MIALLASVMIATNAPAAEVVATCRSMVPEDAELKGRVILRSRKGIVRSCSRGAHCAFHFSSNTVA